MFDFFFFLRSLKTSLRYKSKFLFYNIGKDNIYHVEKLIGSGAFAKVYLARKEDPDFDPDNTETDDESCVVLKVMRTIFNNR